MINLGITRIPTNKFQKKHDHMDHSHPSHPKKVSFPERCDEFAEFLGIFFGECSISDRPPVITISLSYSKEREYALFIKKLIGRLFKVKAGMVRIKGTDNIHVRIYRVNLVRFFETNIERNTGFPKWIKENPRYLTSCLRGMMDSEVSIYRVERGKRRIRMELKIFNPELLEDVYRALESFGFHPRIYRTRNKVILARQEEVDRYFREIGFHNSKHIKKYLFLRGIQSSIAPVV
ncbi:MAG: hypothetical protein OEY39_06475 [Candidatus Bathyarchaeota archaeon]|nr:hypothetical protein [Candidatus Bathyarchaeota archaeon]